MTARLFGIRIKPTWQEFPGMKFYPEAVIFPQDAFDALGVALYARDTNARGIADALGLDAA